MRCKILIADDDDDIREVLADFLVDEGYEIITASDGVEALEAAISFQPDTIILDNRMPRMEGVHVAKSLMEQGISLHIVFLSAAQGIQALVNTLGCCFISKPFGFDVLLEHLTSACDGTACKLTDPSSGLAG